MNNNLFRDEIMIFTILLFETRSRICSGVADVRMASVLNMGWQKVQKRAPRMWWSTAAFFLISLHFSAFLLISLHSLHFFAFFRISLRFPAFSAFLYIELHFSEFLCILMHFSLFLCISLHFSASLCIYLHFYAYLCILLHFSAFVFISLFFLCISLHFSLCILVIIFVRGLGENIDRLACRCLAATCLLTNRKDHIPSCCWLLLLSCSCCVTLYNHQEVVDFESEFL